MTKAAAPQRGLSRVGTRRKHRGQEKQVGTGALSRPNLPEIMCRRSSQAASAVADAAAMAAIGARRLRQARGAGKQEQQTAAPRYHAQPREQRASFGDRQAVMTKHHS
jgi:hypothetical protein